MEMSRKLVEPEINDAGLLPQEQEVMDCIVDAWGKFIRLEVQHPEDVREFGYGVHLLQGLLAMRAVRRAYPKGWYNRKGVEE